MKIYALYYQDKFVVAFLNRMDCVFYGKEYYEGLEWDCNIVEKYLHDYPKFMDTKPITPLTTTYTTPHTIQHTTMHSTSEQNIPSIWGKSGFMVDYTQTPKTNN